MTDPAIEGMRLAELATPGPWTARMWTEGHIFGHVHARGAPVANIFNRKNDVECVANQELVAHAGTHYAAICKRALVAEAKLVESHKALDACHAAYAPTAEAAQLLSVHLVEAHGADLYGKPHAETIRCAHSKLAAMQRVVEAAVKQAETRKAYGFDSALMRSAVWDTNEAVRAYQEAPRG